MKGQGGIRGDCGWLIDCFILVSGCISYLAFGYSGLVWFNSSLSGECPYHKLNK